MKRQFFVILTVLCTLLAGVHLSHAQNIYNANGAQVSSVDSNGTLRDRSNRSVGKIESDGTIRDGQGRTMGKVESDGTVRDDRNSQIGKIESDGTVRDRQNRSIGRASGVKKEWAAVVIFFRF